jgi:CMP-N,N'-diacetyllegionaminic acid synthase
MRILTLITARGGSKRVPKKNIKNLSGKPLLCWSIEAALNNSYICDILVSTDDKEIADIAKENGAMVPWLRPKELSSDGASSVDAALHALDWYEKNYGVVDGLLLLQPTSPFRTEETISKAIELFKKDKERAVISVSPARDHPMWCYKIEDEKIVPFIEKKGEHLMSQDLPMAYITNGSIYIISSEQLRATKSFYPENSRPMIMERFEEGLDIDTEWDWKIAEMASNSYLQKSEL